MAKITRLATIALLLALTATSAMAAPGDCELLRGADTPDDAADDVSICQQDVWIHQADTKAGNLPAYAGAGDYPSWDTNEPTASVQAGAGGGYLAVAPYNQNVNRQDPKAAPTFRGTFTGPLENLGVTLYLFSPARMIGSNQAVSLTLNIDGQTVYQTGSEADRTPLQPAGDAVLKTDFAFVNIYSEMEMLGLDTSPDAVHEVELIISQWFSVNDNAMYVYDTTEVPSGIKFNLGSAGLRMFQARFNAAVG